MRAALSSHAQLVEVKQCRLLAAQSAKGSRDISHTKILLPLHSIQCVIALAGTVKPEEASQPVRAQLSLQHFQGIALELFIGHLFDSAAPG